MKLLYVVDLMYLPGGKIEEGTDFSQPTNTVEFNSNLIIIVLYVEY